MDDFIAKKILLLLDVYFQVRESIQTIQVTWNTKACREYTCQELFDRTSVSLENLGNVLDPNQTTSVFSSMIAASSKDNAATQSKADELSKASCRKRLANCYIQQINLFAELCKDRNYIAINALQSKFTYEMCISVIARTNIHRRIRSSFVKLCTALWIDVAPQQKLILPSFTRNWLNTSCNLETLPHAENSNKFVMLQELIANHFKASGGTMDHMDEDENHLTLNLLGMTYHLVNFGFYNTIGALTNLCDPLVATLDGRNDNATLHEEVSGHGSGSGSGGGGSGKKNNTLTRRKSIGTDPSNYSRLLTKKKTLQQQQEEEKNIPRGGVKNKKQKQKQKLTMVVPFQNLMSEDEQEDDGLGNGVSELNDQLRYARNDQNDIVAQAKTIICNILLIVTRFTTDVRLSHVIHKLRTMLEKNITKENILYDGKGTEMLLQVMKETEHLDTDNLSEHTNIYDVLMDLCKYDNSKLLNSAVELMLAQVSQHRRLLDSATNLQLLFSTHEVEAWDTITKTVAQVLDLIERHEVWAELKNEKGGWIPSLFLCFFVSLFLCFFVSL